MTQVMAKQMDAKRPQYLVIFKEVSERNTGTLSRVLKRGQAAGVRGRPGVQMLAAGESGVMAKTYERLGVAAADLSATQLAELRKRNDVTQVVENQVRYLPPATRSAEGQDADTTEPASTPIIAYLQGLRDAANLALSYQTNRPSLLQGTAMSAETNAPLAVRTTWGLRAIGVAPSFAAPTGRGVKVAVLDTGIDLAHPDLSGKVVEGVSAVSLVTGITVNDVFGHGTHCAGTIAGPRHSSSGRRYGVAPDVDLLIGKVFNNAAPRPGAFDDDILEGITWADENGARIISLSLGSTREINEPFSALYESLASQLLNRTTNSVLIVAAAGNDSERPTFTAPVNNPAACPSILAVAAVDHQGRVASFSCQQMDAIGEVNVSGPGVGVFSSVPGGRFEAMDGTSMATPHVAGLAALYLEQNPQLTARQLLDQLKSRARPLGNPIDFGAGLIRV